MMNKVEAKKRNSVWKWQTLNDFSFEQYNLDLDF